MMTDSTAPPLGGTRQDGEQPQFKMLASSASYLKFILLLVSIISCCMVRRNLCLCKLGDASPHVRYHLISETLSLRERSLLYRSFPPVPFQSDFFLSLLAPHWASPEFEHSIHSHGVLSDVQSCIHRLPGERGFMGQPIISRQRFTFCARVPWALHVYHTTFHLVSNIVLHDWLVPGGDYA